MKIQLYLDWRAARAAARAVVPVATKSSTTTTTRPSSLGAEPAPR